jgi:hypothetical protein
LRGELGAALPRGGQRVSVGERLTVWGSGPVDLGGEAVELRADI